MELSQDVFTRLDEATAAAAVAEGGGMEGGDGQFSLATRAREYLERRRLRAESHAKQVEDSMLSQLRPKPEINLRSQQLAASRGRNAEDISIALYEEAELLRLSKQMRAQELLEAEMLGSPAITKQAALLVREGKVEDRLYQLAIEKHAMVSERMEDECNKASRRQRRASESSVKHTEELYRKALEQRKHRELLGELEAQELRKKAKPRLSKKTRQLAAEMGQTSQERLLTNAKSKKPATTPRVSTNPQDEELTFKPRINPRSKEILHKEGLRGSVGSTASVSTEATHDRLYKEYTVRAARRSSLASSISKTKEELDLEECTFQPKISRLSRDLVEDGDQHDILSRLQEWEERRAARLEQQRRAREAELKQEDCTFTPKTNSKSRKAVQATDAMPARGFEQFIERQRRAREEKERIQKAQSGRSSKWTNKITVPVAPNLGTARRQRAPPSTNATEAEATSQQDPKRMTSSVSKANKATSSEQHKPHRRPPPPPPAKEDDELDSEQGLDERDEDLQLPPQHYGLSLSRSSSLAKPQPIRSRAFEQDWNVDDVGRVSNNQVFSPPPPPPQPMSFEDTSAPLRDFRVLSSLLRASNLDE